MDNGFTYWTDTITLFSKRFDEETQDTTYASAVYTGCFWKETFDEVSSQDGSAKILSAVVRIPALAMGGITIATDDILVLGAVTSYEPADGVLAPADMSYLTQCLKADNKPVGTVYSVSDNTRHGVGIPHVKVRCRL